jgi:hypothetical protein
LNLGCTRQKMATYLPTAFSTSSLFCTHFTYYSRRSVRASPGTTPPTPTRSSAAGIYRAWQLTYILQMIYRFIEDASRYKNSASAVNLPLFKSHSTPALKFHDALHHLESLHVPGLTKISQYFEILRRGLMLWYGHIDNYYIPYAIWWAILGQSIHDEWWMTSRLTATWLPPLHASALLVPPTASSS